MVRFHENKIDPPSRAYLKLWESFTLLPKRPGPGDLCLDLGSAPGGWTWVLASLGAQVFSIDKAPLAPQVDHMPGVSHCIGSGFALDPRHAGAVDWLFSDMICYPDMLYEVICRWIELAATSCVPSNSKPRRITPPQRNSRLFRDRGSCICPATSTNSHGRNWNSRMLGFETT